MSIKMNFKIKEAPPAVRGDTSKGGMKVVTLENGAELNAIKELLGHASLASTQVYTHNTIDQLKNIHHLAHPKG